jgi:ATP/maltotriose-dependent transcriptional regulator MalT
LTETISAAVSPALAHIIERPRLIARLEEGGGSRISMFAAPAGYGKTTLARQWEERQHCPVVWYRTNRASGDVALLAVQFDELFASLAPDLPREPGKVAAIAAANPSPSPLSSALVHTFGAIDGDILVIVDEWETAATEESGELLAMIVDGIPVRWVVTTRERPDWFGPRRTIYGEGLEIGVDELRMTDEEAIQILAAAGAVAGQAHVMRTAAGWPAVLGLAAMRGGVDLSSDRLLSHTFDEFLIDELLAAATAETQEALMLLAVSSIVDTGRAELLLGEKPAREAISNASVHGLVAVGERTALFFHPLLRDLLVRRFEETAQEKRRILLNGCRRLIDNRLWDEALSVGELSHDGDFIVDAMTVGLDDLLGAGRTKTLERWVNAARSAGSEGAVIDYVEAELNLRQGNFDHALGLAACAGDALAGDLAARAHLVAARAANLAGRLVLRDSHLEAAGRSATAPRTVGVVRWLRIAAAVEAQLPNTDQLTEELLRVDDLSHEHVLRVASADLHHGFLDGQLRERVEAAEGSVALVDTCSDPYASTSFLSALAYALFATGEYRGAIALAEKEIAIATEFGLSFATPYGEINRAHALIALREFAEARRALSGVEKHLRTNPNPYLASGHADLSAMLAISRGDLVRAADHLARGNHPRAKKKERGGRHALNALVFSALDREEEARDEVRRARRLSRTVTTRAVLAASAAIRSAARGDSAGCIRAYEETSELGVVYPLVLAWRARYEVAAVLLRSREHRDSVLPLLLDSNDTAIARRSGVSLPRIADQRLGLSAREQEVCDLLAQDRTNPEIAATLSISLSTTKIHVKHILEKLGVRSRVEAGRLWEEGAS